jgi:hypothetical protein
MGISIEILSAISAAQSIPSAFATGLTTATVLSFVGFLAGIFALLLHELGTPSVRARRASVPVYFIGSGFASALAATVCILASTQPIFATITALASLLTGLLGVVVVLWIEDRPPSGV